MTTSYTNPAEYLNCTDAELSAEYTGKTAEEIKASLDEIYPGETNAELAQAIKKQLNS